VRTRGRGETGISIIEILISVLLISAVVVANGALIRSLGLLGITQSTPNRFERPARLRTVAMEYIQAELEYLRNRPYEAFNLTAPCAVGFTNLPQRPGLGSPGIPGTVPANGYLPGEPPLPGPFAAAQIAVASEPITGVAPFGCPPRQVSVAVYLTAADVASGVVFARGVTAVSPR
jgi:hypothetical protein